jgi:predicted ribosome quality control (RQC) complex YloA/Tae2 family protein
MPDPAFDDMDVAGPILVAENIGALIEAAVKRAIDPFVKLIKDQNKTMEIKTNKIDEELKALQVKCDKQDETIKHLQDLVEELEQYG